MQASYDLPGGFPVDAPRKRVRRDTRSCYQCTPTELGAIILFH